MTAAAVQPLQPRRAELHGHAPPIGGAAGGGGGGWYEEVDAGAAVGGHGRVPRVQPCRRGRVRQGVQGAPPRRRGRGRARARRREAALPRRRAGNPRVPGGMHDAHDAAPPQPRPLVGYCADAGERILVYEFLPRGSLDAHLFGGDGGRRQLEPPLGWGSRVRITLGAARGLRYLHVVVTPPVIYRDLKASNILLDDDLSPKLSDFGLAKLGPVGDDTHVSTRVMGTYGYCAPDYAMSGKLNVKSDVYSFGVVLLELITGRRAFDAAPEEERLLLWDWARPYLAGDRKRCFALADPALQGRYPRRAFYQLAVVISLCLRDNPNLRPSMTDVTRALDHVASQSHPWEHKQRSTPD